MYLILEQLTNKEENELWKHIFEHVNYACLGKVTAGHVICV